MFWSFAFLLLSAAPLAISSHHDSQIYVNGNFKDRTAMFLPLFFNSHRNKDYFYRRRHLLTSNTSNARMSLYDDLVLNGYYSTRLWIGTPPQIFVLIVDTGSSVTYVPCSNCDQCGKHQDPKFDPQSSSTYQPVKCNSDCTCDVNGEQCLYERKYAEMSSSSGVLGEDIVSFGNLSALEPQRVVFGCVTMETGDLYSQHADGIMGLDRGDLSIMDQLVEKGVINDSFSLCYGGMGVGGGAMVLGAISPPDDMVFTRSDPDRSPYYNVDLREIHVAGKMLPLKSEAFDGKHGTVLDSGTTYAYFPEPVFKAFKEAIFKELQSLKRIEGPDPNFPDICFSGAESDASQHSKFFPTVEMVFSNGQKLSLSPENYMFKYSKMDGAYCLGVFQNNDDPTTLLGGIITRNTLVTYDREHEKIGFWKTNCSVLWENLHRSFALPPLLSDTDKNSTMSFSHTMAPTEPLPEPPETEIGLITFDMSLTVKPEELKPHVTELVQLIAKELRINASQVELMNFTSGEYGTLISWTISPAGYTDYISNSTAMDIISRLSENRVHLPDKFGSYKLIEWNIEPPPRWTWWKQHLLAIVVGLVAVIIVGVVASGLWVVRRREHSQIGYNPVSEQELQPLQ